MTEFDGNSQFYEFAFVRDDDETLEVYLNGTLVANANHDEHGWAGMGLLEDAIENIAKVIGAKVIEP